MRFFTRMWTAVTTVTHWLALSPFEEGGLSQQPIGAIHHVPAEIPMAEPLAHKKPLTSPPGSNIPGFKCNYTLNMGTDWYDCTAEYTGCWIKNKVTKQVYDIYTDYETDRPIGINRTYVLNVTDEHTINVDGIPFEQAKLFNNKFPGPLLEACWGDTLNITVINSMKWNGTSIHWHGIRQNQTMHMDGVNGITQCPIAPNSSFTYIWNVTQYGSSWYHSHYSVQYADGLQGPITLHGPTSVDYDEAVTPLLTSDWLHNTAFDAESSQNLSYPTILLNGMGNCQRFYGKYAPKQCKAPTSGFEYTFNKTAPSGKGLRKFLLRIINTSYSTAITFSIDNHTMTVIEADFVPTVPSNPVETIVVSIGQRYHVIVEALANPFLAEPNGNYWIRTNSSGCFDDVVSTNITGFERTGIIRYNPASKADPGSLPWPGNQPPADDTLGLCTDDLTSTLRPVFNWTVTQPKNGVSGETFNVTFPNTTWPNPPLQYSNAFVAFTPLQGPSFNTTFPFQTTYGDPTFLNLDNDEDSWPQGWVVVPENFTDNDFVYLILQNGGHPIHLHGHDFAVLEYEKNKTFNGTLNAPYVNNTMRRDVILIPPSGYTVIAFKTDNPGVWLMHCHIAFHASGGLSLQIMERQTYANNVIWPPGQSNALRAARKTCRAWNDWAYDCRNMWPGVQPIGNKTYYPACGNNTMIQNDSGV